MIIKFLWNKRADACDIADGLQTDCRQTSGTVWWICLSTSNDLILYCRGTAQSSRPAWWNSHWKTSAWWSWHENCGYIEQISVWILISSFDIDNWETACCSSNSVAVFAFAWVIPFASNHSICIGSVSVDRQFMQRAKGGCKSYVAILACCPTWWLASSCDWWSVMIFLEYIATSHVNSIERWYSHKTET
jgi:hypothetical protein